MNFNQLKEKASIVSDKVFGPQNPKTAPVRKLTEEVEELLESLMIDEDPSEEFADCFLLLIDAYRKHFGDDVDMQKLIDDSSKKLDIVAKRVWGDPDEHGVFQHIKEEKPGGYQYDNDYDGRIPDYLDEPLKLPDEDQEPKKEWKPEFDIELVQKVYDDVALNVALNMADKVTREKIKEQLKNKLPSDFDVKCDDENNPPDVQDRGEIWVRVSKTDKPTNWYQYIDLVF